MLIKSHFECRSRLFIKCSFWHTDPQFQDAAPPISLPLMCLHCVSVLRTDQVHLCLPLRGRRLNQFNLLSLSAPAVTKPSGHFLYMGQMSSALSRGFTWWPGSGPVISCLWRQDVFTLLLLLLHVNQREAAVRFKDTATKGAVTEVLTVLTCFMNFWAEGLISMSKSKSGGFFFYVFLLVKF